MTVHDSEDQRLGHVTRCYDDYFEVKKGVVFEHVWMVPFSDVEQTKGHDVQLNRPRGEQAEVLAGYVMRGGIPPSMASSANKLQHWLSANR